MKKSREVLITIKSLKLLYFGHIMRNESRYALLQAILQRENIGDARPRKEKNILAEEPQNLEQHNIRAALLHCCRQSEDCHDDRQHSTDRHIKNLVLFVTSI